MFAQACVKPFIVAFASLTLAACASSPPRADLNAIYQRSAQYHEPDRNPIIVIPGILGSQLVDTTTGETVWGAFRGSYADPRNPEDAVLIALPIEEDTPFEFLDDAVEPNGVLETLQIRLLGVPIDLRAYVGILSTLGVGGYRDETLGLNGVDYGDDHFTCFQFDYDWRRDNVENAARLKAFIDDRRAYIQEQYRLRYGIEDAEVKFDIVAHSMGGLLTRYFLRYGDARLPEDGTLPDLTWAGAEDVERVILVGTPNGGASETFEQLQRGYTKGRPILPVYPSFILGTFPSVYQLLPRPRQNRIRFDDAAGTPVRNLYDGELWARYGWGLSSDSRKTRDFLRLILPDAPDDAARRQIAQSYQAAALARAEAFHQALDRPAAPPDGLDLFLVAGDAVRTPYQVTVNQETGKSEVTDYGPGDGSVPRYSALGDERISGDWQPVLNSPIRWTDVTFLSSTHIGLTTDPAFADNVLYKLLEAPRD